jgi:putative endopeptidase
VTNPGSRAATVAGVVAIFTLTSCATATKAAPQFGSFGLDLAGRDLTVKPGDDFYRHSGGVWMRNEPMPNDRTRWGSFDALAAKAETNVRAILDELAASAPAAGTVEQKVADYYRSYLDVQAINTAGLAPLAAIFASIRAAENPEAIARLISSPDVPSSGPLAVAVSLDAKNPDRYVLVVTHAGLGLPEREYYLRDDVQFAELRQKYQQHLGRLLALGQWPDAEAAASRIVAFETEIAKLHWPIARRRDRDATYNLKTWSELLALAPDYPWAASFQSAGLPSDAPIVVRELSSIGPLAALFRATPTATLRDYLAASVLRSSADVLPEAIDREVFDFNGNTLNGQPEQRARWKRGVGSVSGVLGEAVGQIYVRRHFSPQAKVAMQQVVENLRSAYGQRIDQLPWMSAATKQVARQKLATFRAKIGYPDKWRDYSKLQVRAGDAFGNMLRAKVFDWQRDVARLGQKTDRDEWLMPPQQVNAYYNPVFNEIVFPAAILQPPFFDLAADPALNYGGIGGVIGHEMGHGFDDQGAKSDANGVLRTWWNANDEAAFKSLGDRLAAQYGQYEPLPGLKINGRLTLGENIGDLGGLSVAWAAYRLSLAGRPAPVIDGLNGDQRLFHGWAQVWRSLYRDERMRNQLLTDPHSPPEYRVNAVVRNIDAWYEAFGVKPGDKLWLPPEQRVHIW